MGRGRVGAVLVGIILGVLCRVPGATAVEKCKVKVTKGDGTINVSARGVAGTLLWGTTPGSETNAFFNAATCVAGGKAKACLLGDAGTDTRITPPPLCTLYLADSMGTCSVFIQGCTPGARGDLPAVQAGLSSLQATVGTLSADVSSLTTQSKQMTLAAPGFANLASFTVAPGDAAGGLIEYTIVATDGGSQVATERGTIRFNATPNAITCSVDPTTKVHLGTVNSGCTPGFFNPGPQPGISVFDNVSFFTPAAVATHVVYYRIANVSNSPTRLEP